MFGSSYRWGHYHPLTWLSWALDYRLFGTDPWGYHLTNVLLHAANAALVYALLRALIARARPDGGGAAAPFAAAVGALVFALHPQRVESVAWVTERRDVLAGFFYLLAVLAYLRRTTGRPGFWLAVSVATCALSLLAKAWAMTIPLVLLVLDVYPLRRLPGSGWRRVVIEKVPYAVLAVSAAAAAAYAQHAVGAMVPLAELGPGDRVVQALYGTAFYLWKALVPRRLSPLYPLESFHPDAVAVRVVAGGALLLTLAALAGYRRWPALAAAWACYLLVLAPVLGLAQSGMHFAADRFTYLAIVPLVALLAGGLDAWLQRRPRHTAGGLPLAVAVLLALLVSTRGQIAVWADARTLWTRVVDLYPDSYNGWHNLGLVQLAAGDARRGLENLDRAVTLAPNFAPAFNSRGAARQAMGDLAGARADLDRAVALTPTWPDPYNNRGNVRLAAGDIDGALADYDQVLDMAPDHVRARFNRALARERARDVKGALADIDVLIVTAPDYAYGYATRVRYRAALGDLDGALADCEQALRLLPPGSDDARTVAGYRTTLEERRRAAQR